MQLVGFQVQMYKCVIDSGWIEVNPLTVLVGKNESGKTSLLKALHKLNPFRPEPYVIEREWPRGFRREQNQRQIVCRAKFELSDEERSELEKLTNTAMTATSVEVTRDYGGNLEIKFPDGVFPDSIHPNDVDKVTAVLPSPSAPVGEPFRNAAAECVEEARRLAREGRFAELEALASDHQSKLQAAKTPGNSQPQATNEQQFVNGYFAKLKEIADLLSKEPTMQRRAHDFVVGNLPTFIYMDEYRTFTGTAYLDQVKQRRDRKNLTPEDKTLLTIIEMSGLDLDQEVEKSTKSDREQRQYDLDDAAATLSREMEGHWGQLTYEIRFGADGPQFFTWVKDQKDRALIRLEERSKGFQWFFSFDLLFMHESKGGFRNCVLLLDEPGLHLHPEGQEDLLKRLDVYAKDNTLIYSSHLPFMIDLRAPERIRVVSETEEGTAVSTDLATTQPEGKLTLQAALGIKASQSYLVSQRNLVVEGVDDYWIITDLSNILLASGERGLDDDVLVTAAGGASEVAYIATFMIGQGLEVVALVDSDDAGDQARDKLVKRWLHCYNGYEHQVLSLGPAVGETDRLFSIEDLFPDDFYLEAVRERYCKELAQQGVTSLLPDPGQDMLVKRVERALGGFGIKFKKGSVAKALRRKLHSFKAASELPAATYRMAVQLFEAIGSAMQSKQGSGTRLEKAKATARSPKHSRIGQD